MIISTQHTIAMAHRLFSYDGLCNQLHGHNWKVQVDVSGPVGSFGMVMEFARLKKTIREVLDSYDHSVILDGADSMYDALVDAGQIRIYVLAGPPTTERIAQLFFDLLSDKINSNATQVVKVTVFETQNNVAVCDARRL